MNHDAKAFQTREQYASTTGTTVAAQVKRHINSVLTRAGGANPLAPHSVY